jgi:hypothetical protein
MIRRDLQYTLTTLFLANRKKKNVKQNERKKIDQKQDSTRNNNTNEGMNIDQTDFNGLFYACKNKYLQPLSITILLGYGTTKAQN